ncbi:hypothetical protein CPT_Matapan_042 [Salmonella phage Matapan]|nr:hypothetical protein CPT_Matapan_042 [Salmonella phage Matapan]
MKYRSLLYTECPQRCVSQRISLQLCKLNKLKRASGVMG